MKRPTPYMLAVRNACELRLHDVVIDQFLLYYPNQHLMAYYCWKIAHTY